MNTINANFLFFIVIELYTKSFLSLDKYVTKQNITVWKLCETELREKINKISVREIRDQCVTLVP